MHQGLPIIFSAPSGTGKTTTCKILREKLPDLKVAVSHTTRDIRKGEKDGEDYNFVSTEEFENKIKNNDFLEWARVHDFYYGTSLQSADKLLKNGYDTLIELDVQGVETLRKMNYKGVFILILPPSLEEMEARLRKRGTDSEESIQRRLKTGKEEIKKYKMYDYVVTNNEIEGTVNTLLAIIKAEKTKVSKYCPGSPDIQALLKDEVD
ncbi:MAG: guanylate kinase [Nitrospinae bacterium]|nr:guanylate kinase [Nitrospinota bacterium]